jgi:hypothetical protein
MPRALGKFVKLRKNEKLSRYHYYLRLPDLLMDVVERDSGAPQAERLGELAHSFAQDVLNLAVLASRLLWHEALTPDMSRSPDLVAVGTDTESYFLFLKAACDVLAEMAVEVGVEPARRGQVRSESFDKLSKWIRENPSRIDSKFQFLGEEVPWFNELHGIRTNLAHRGFDMLIYTDRIRFSFLTAPFGRIETRLLRESQGQPAESRRHTLTPLLPLVKRLTVSMLGVSGQLATAALAHLGLEAPSRTHALCGVYVPGLHGLDSYEPPVESPRLKIIVDCLHHSGEYLAASKLGFPDGYWWQFLIGLSEHFGISPADIGRFVEGPPDVLVDWRIIFVVGGERFGIVARDMILMENIWLKGAQEDLEGFAAREQLARAILVTRHAHKPSGQEDQNEPTFPVVVADEPSAAARAAFDLLTNRNP